jgi:hypothetical protein
MLSTSREETPEILDAELFNAELGFHHRISSAQLNLLVNESRWSYGKGGYEHAE